MPERDYRGDDGAGFGYELIVVNGGSKDRTHELAEEMAIDLLSYSTAYTQPKLMRMRCVRYRFNVRLEAIV
jgi:glycosyltransferase involved in cell wall biosynthesis